MDPEEAYEKIIAYTFIQGTNRIRTGKIEEYLANWFALGVNSYPCDLSRKKNTTIIRETMLTTQTVLERESNNQRNIRIKNQMKKIRIHSKGI